MFTPPEDLDAGDLVSGLRGGWGIRGDGLVYRAVGFGSHHWDVVDDAGGRWFVSVDDLRTRRLTADEPLEAAEARLAAALGAALALREGGLGLVVAPVPARDGRPLVMIDERFALAVYPFVVGESFGWGKYTDEHRQAILGLLADLHSAVPPAALRDDYLIPSRDAVTASIQNGVPPTGPYAEKATELLAANQEPVSEAFARYDAAVTKARSDPPAFVLTHGEPHPGNTMRAEDGRWLLIDWDTALLAPPERDLWSVDPGDGSILEAYTRATGVRPRTDLLELYRLRWDLADMAASLSRFREPHGTGKDDEESWTILQETVTSLAG